MFPDFDEQDQTSRDRLLRHFHLEIPYSGTLEPGYIWNAMDVRNGQNAQITKIKQSGEDIANTCFGEAERTCFTLSFYLQCLQLLDLVLKVEWIIHEILVYNTHYVQKSTLIWFQIEVLSF